MTSVEHIPSLWYYTYIPPPTPHTNCLPPVGYVYDQRMTLHSNPLDDNHPESPERIQRIFHVLQQRGLLEDCVQIPTKEAPMKDIRLVHSSKYCSELTRLERDKENCNDQQLNRVAYKKYNSVFLNSDSFVAARVAAGGVSQAVSSVLSGKCRSAVAIVRPPGHHAENHCAMGFCIFNNVGVAVRAARKRHLANRILIVDWDIHHGNGTQKMFWDDPNVLFFSVHRFDNGRFYPGTNAGHPSSIGHPKLAPGTTINVGWNEYGMGDKEYRAVWEHLLLPVAREFDPDLVVVSAGFDAALGDPLGRCSITPEGYAYLTRKLLDLAHGRVVLALEGGYNLSSISNSCAACVQELIQHTNTDPELIDVEFKCEEPEDDDPLNTVVVPLDAIKRSAKNSILQTRRSQSKYWKCLSA